MQLAARAAARLRSAHAIERAAPADVYFGAMPGLMSYLDFIFSDAEI